LIQAREGDNRVNIKKKEEQKRKKKRGTWYALFAV
jgi:hypothetical protein